MHVLIDDIEINAPDVKLRMPDGSLWDLADLGVAGAFEARLIGDRRGRITSPIYTSPIAANAIQIGVMHRD